MASPVQTGKRKGTESKMTSEKTEKMIDKYMDRAFMRGVRFSIGVIDSLKVAAIREKDPLLIGYIKALIDAEEGIKAKVGLIVDPTCLEEPS